MRLYERLFTDTATDEGDKNFLDAINPQSLQVLTGCIAEPALLSATVGETFQFEREGYFCLDNSDAS